MSNPCSVKYQLLVAWIFFRGVKEALHPVSPLTKHRGRPWVLLLTLLFLISQATSEPVLDPQQIQAFDQLCHLYRGSSRVMLVWLFTFLFPYL